MENNFIISTEVTSDLSKDLLEKYEIKAVNMSYLIDNTDFNSADNNFTSEDFYNAMRSGASTSTSQVNYECAKQYLEELLKQNKNVLHISFSSALSGTYENFKRAEKVLNEVNKNKVYVVSSLCASAGQGLLAILASKKAREESSFENIIKYVEETKLRICHLFTVDDLKYLYKSGRVSKTSASIGTLFKIKPLLNVDNLGRLMPVKNILGRKRVIKVMADNLKEKIDKNHKEIIIAHADCIEDANYLSGFITAQTGITPIIVDLGFIIGSHSGPGTLAVFFVANNR